MIMARWAAVAVAALSLSAGAAGAEDVIQLGASVPLTGKYSADGKSTLEGYTLAVDRINEKGGVKVGAKTYKLELVQVDDESKPEKAAAETEAMITTKGVKFMLGSYATPMIKTQIPVVEKHKIPFVEGEGGAKSLFSPDHKYVFGVLNLAEQYFEPVIDMLLEQAKRTGQNPASMTVAVVVEPEPFSRAVGAGVMDDAGKYGMKTVVNAEFPKELDDMAPILEKIKAAKPTLLIVSGHAKGAKLLASQLPKTGVKIPMIGVTHCDDARLTETFGQAVEGYLCPSQWDASIPFRDRWFGTAKGFDEAYKARFARSPSYQAAQAGAVVEVFASAFEKAGSLDTRKVRDAIAEGNLKTFYGAIRFDESGINTGKTMVMYQIQHGQYKIIAPVQWKQSDLIYPL